MSAVEEVAASVGVTAAARAVGISPATVYRRRKPPVLGPRPPRPASARSLNREEVDRALGYLHEPRFIDFSPRTIVAVVLDEGEYVACVRTLYRLLVKYGEAKERRDQLLLDLGLVDHRPWRQGDADGVWQLLPLPPRAESPRDHGVAPIADILACLGLHRRPQA